MEHLRQAFDASLAKGKELQVQAGWTASENHFTDLLAENLAQQIRIYCERGVAFRMQEDFLSADHDFLKALSLSRQTGNVDGELESYGGLIDSARKSNRIPLARDYKQDAEMLVAKLPDKPRLSLVNVFINIGLFYHDTKEEGQALKNYGAAEAVCRQLIMQDSDNIDFQNRLARIFTVRPESYKELGMHEEAYKEQITALELNTKLGEVRGLGNSRYSLGEIAEKIDKIDEAREWYKKALLASEKIVDGRTEIIDPVINKMADDALGRLASIQD